MRRTITVAAAAAAFGLTASAAVAIMTGRAVGQEEIHVFSSAADPGRSVLDDLNGNGGWDLGDRLVFAPDRLTDPETDQQLGITTGE